MVIYEISTGNHAHLCKVCLCKDAKEEIQICKERQSQKKKCNEKRPECDRCTQRGIHCQYESLKSRRSFARSALSNCSYDSDPTTSCEEQWSGQYEQTTATQNYEDELVQKWEANSINNFLATYSFPLYWDIPLENDMVGSIRREHLVDKPLFGSSVCLQSQYSDVMSPLLEFSTPVYMEFTDKKNRRTLMEHFCKVLSHLIVFKEDTGNPFRELILPLAYVSSPVMNAILALSSAHLEHKGIENEEKSLDFHNTALQSLAQLIDQGEQASKEEVLSTIMLLVYYEALVSRGNSSFVDGHLRGAITIMKSGLPLSTPTTLFLERAFYFYDVIAALSLGTPPSTSTPPKVVPPTFRTFDSSLPDSPSSEVDTLLGAASGLWPTIHRLSQMLSLKTLLETAIAAGHTSKASILRTEIESTAHGIELALAKWKPHLTLPLKDESGAAESFAEETSIQGILNNAEAYRHSAFVYLYRTIRLRPRSHSSVQKHAHLSLLACSNAVQLAEQCHDVPMPALLWPLFVAACEAMTDEDRALATDAFIGLERRQGMRNIMTAWEVVQEAWRRADLQHCGEVNWRDICEERGFNIVFG